MRKHPNIESQVNGIFDGIFECDDCDYATMEDHFEALFEMAPIEEIEAAFAEWKRQRLV